MWFPFGDDGRIPACLQQCLELKSQTLVPLSSPDFYRKWKSFGPPTYYPPSSPNRVTMVDRAAPRLEWSRGIDFSKW